MRVLVLTSAYAPVIGGAESYALNLQRGLEMSGVQAGIFTDDVGSPSRPDPHPFLVRASRYKALLQASDKVRWEQMQFGLLAELEAAAQTFKPDILHANSHETAVLASMAALSLNVPVVASFHEQSPESAPLGHGRCTLVYRHLPLACIIAGSRFYYDKAISHGAQSNRVELVPHGIDLSRFRPQAQSNAFRGRWGLSNDETIVLCAARISPRKGQLELVRAFASVNRMAPKSRLVLAGSCHSGSEAYLGEIRAEIASNQLASLVRIDSDLGPDDMPTAYAAADVVVQPSREEGLGLALIEAMACQRCVVATDVVGIREVITSPSVGVLVPYADSKALVEGLVGLCLSPRWRASLGRAAREHVIAHYQLERMANATKDIYRRVLTECVRHQF